MMIIYILTILIPTIIGMYRGWYHERRINKKGFYVWGFDHDVKREYGWKVYIYRTSDALVYGLLGVMIGVMILFIVHSIIRLSQCCPINAPC